LANYTRDPPKEVSLPLRLPLVGLPNQRAASPSEDSRLVNGYVEFGQDEVIRVVKRPGLTELYDNGGYGAGMYKQYSIFYDEFISAWRALIYEDGTQVAGLTPYTPFETTPTRFFSFNLSRTGLESTTIFFHDRYNCFTYDTTDGLEELAWAGQSTVGPDSYNLVEDDTLIVKASGSTAGLLKYSAISGTGIADGTLIESIDSTTDITMSLPATAGGGISALTFTLSGPPARDGVSIAERQLAGGVTDLNTSVYLFTYQRAIVGSDPLGPRAWDPLNIIYAYAEEDEAVYVAKNLSYLVAFKETTTEFFRDVGVSPGSPLERLEGLRLAIGCYQWRTVQDIDGYLIWCSFTASGLKSVHLMFQTKTEEIATPAIRRVLEQMTPLYAIAFSISGHSFYILTDPTAGISLCYDITTKFWSYWNALGTTYFPFVASSYVASDGGGTRLQHESNGKIYLIAPDTVLDGTEAVVMDIYTPLFDANMRQSKYLERMYVNADQEVGSILKLRVNDEDQAEDEWTDYREFDLGHPRPALYDCGSFTKRNFHFRHESATACRLVSVELDLLPGTL